MEQTDRTGEDRQGPAPEERCGACFGSAWAHVGGPYPAEAEKDMDEPVVETVARAAGWRGEGPIRYPLEADRRAAAMMRMAWILVGLTGAAAQMVQHQVGATDEPVFALGALVGANIWASMLAAALLGANEREGAIRLLADAVTRRPRVLAHTLAGGALLPSYMFPDAATEGAPDALPRRQTIFRTAALALLPGTLIGGVAASFPLWYGVSGILPPAVWLTYAAWLWGMHLYASPTLRTIRAETTYLDRRGMGPNEDGPWDRFVSRLLGAKDAVASQIASQKGVSAEKAQDIAREIPLPWVFPDNTTYTVTSAAHVALISAPLGFQGLVLGYLVDQHEALRIERWLGGLGLVIATAGALTGACVVLLNGGGLF